MNKTIGQQLRTARVSANLSQNKAAIKAELTPKFISLLERDERNASTNSYSNLAKAYDRELVLRFRKDGSFSLELGGDDVAI